METNGVIDLIKFFINKSTDRENAFLSLILTFLIFTAAILFLPENSQLYKVPGYLWFGLTWSLGMYLSWKIKTKIGRKKSNPGEIRLSLREWFAKQVKPLNENKSSIVVGYNDVDKELGIINGGTKAFIKTIAHEKGYKCLEESGSAAIFDVDFERMFDNH